MTREEIEDAVVDIMLGDGPDGHCDGSDIIADFIVALLNGDGEIWINDYRGGEK